ncbi:MAG TPA: RdgB/HAM1 family non-canonical purine NTP pyrophosphatase [Verrucomicrobiae bacterium]|nr:RdgB/HAM1 family non-canonical purine NTP pyrophosphatase [Verrucomicrobiae bacterium]
MTLDVVLASSNRRKLAELQDVLAPLGWGLRPLSDFTATQAEEPAPTFVENALLKARHASRIAGLPALSDDSGIEVDALNGAPGVRSARYAGDDASDDANNARLLEALAEVPDGSRGARYISVLAFVRHADDPVPVIAQGTWRGRILRAARGAGGFGYDPLFWVESHGCSSAELAPAVKNRLSHRARAAAALLQAVRG